MLKSARYLKAENEYALLQRLVKRLEATGNRERYFQHGGSKKI